jgi:hypothetical protein
MKKDEGQLSKRNSLILEKIEGQIEIDQKSFSFL